MNIEQNGGINIFHAILQTFLFFKSIFFINNTFVVEGFELPSFCKTYLFAILVAQQFFKLVDYICIKT